MSNNLQGWIGVDLDGTLAKYGEWQGPTHIGIPIAPMVARVRAWLEAGRDVRIFTARVAQWPNGGKDIELVRRAIEEWCVAHLGRALPVTCTKDYMMSELWDDRAIQVIPNTGLRVDGNP